MTSLHVAKMCHIALERFSESLLADHFGEAIIDDLFERYAERIGEHLSMEKTKNFNIVISMARK